MVSQNLFKLRQRISSVCSRINRDPNSITIVAVSKGRPIEQIREVINAGIADIGENKVQEALIKYNELMNLRTREQITVKWHLVGHLQSNKVKEALKLFDLIHSVDTLRLAQEINKQAAKINKIQDVLIEVNTSAEASKFGLKPDEVIGVIEEIAKLSNINFRGLMTIAPVVDNQEKARPYFRELKELSDKIISSHVPRPTSYVLSMGMTDDFEVAIEEGATMVRIGRAIFEEQSIVDRKGISVDR